MIFTRIRVGEIVKPWAIEGKYPCVFFPCFIPTIFIKKDCWWLRQLIVLGSGVAGLSVLTHTHTLPTILFFILSRRYFSLHDCSEGSRTSNFRVLPVVCSSTDKNGVVFPHAGPLLSVHSSQGQIVFHAQDFPSFYPRIFPL